VEVCASQECASQENIGRGYQGRRLGINCAKGVLVVTCVFVLYVKFVPRAAEGVLVVTCVFVLYVKFVPRAAEGVLVVTCVFVLYVKFRAAESVLVVTCVFVLHVQSLFQGLLKASLSLHAFCSIFQICSKGQEASGFVAPILGAGGKKAKHNEYGAVMNVCRCRKLGLKELVGMGGFKNQREVFKWQGETLELDQTSYDWGTLYEIEVETVSSWSLVYLELDQTRCDWGVRYKIEVETVSSWSLVYKPS
jgi:hypothetical protein